MRFVHVTAFGSRSFILSVYTILLYEYNDGIINNHQSFIHFTVNKHLGSFQFGVYYTVALKCLIGFFWYTFDIGIALGNKLLNYMVFTVLNLVDIASFPN